MSKYVIVWNHNKSEGVIFSKENNEDEALDDAYHAGGGMTVNPCSSIGDNFRETYGEEQDCFSQHVEIDNTKATRIEKDGE